MRNLLFLLILTITACNKKKQIEFTVIDTDFSKGRLTHVQKIGLSDLEKFHGHLCDGLVVGALALQEAMKNLYPNDTIDRTNLRIVSKPSPCLTDVAAYLSGGRYQFNTFYVDTAFIGLYIIQRIDDLKTVSVKLKNGVKPAAIDSIGNLAVQQKLTSCEIEHLRKLEDDFTNFLMTSKSSELFIVSEIIDFSWSTTHKIFSKTDVINKSLEQCKNLK